MNFALSAVDYGDLFPVRFAGAGRVDTSDRRWCPSAAGGAMELIDNS